MIDRLPAKAEGITSCFLLAAPFWVGAMHVATDLGAFVTAMCGAVLGVHSVIRMMRRKDSRKTD